jgi:hypothetical protein
MPPKKKDVVEPPPLIGRVGTNLKVRFGLIACALVYLCRNCFEFRHREVFQFVQEQYEFNKSHF